MSVSILLQFLSLEKMVGACTCHNDPLGNSTTNWIVVLPMDSG
jgi:hypothetical protein